MDEANISSMLNSFNDNYKSPKIKLPIRTTFDSLREEVYFEQPITLVSLGLNDVHLYHIVLDQEYIINFSGMNLSAACVLPDGQIIAIGDKSSAYIYQSTEGWQRIGELLYSRINHAMVYHKGTVYVVGGLGRKEVERLGTENC